MLIIQITSIQIKSHYIYPQEGRMSNCYIKQHPNPHVGHNKIPGTQSWQTSNMEKSFTNQNTDSQCPYTHPQSSNIEK